MKPTLREEAKKGIKKQVESGEFDKNGSVQSLVGSFTQVKVTEQNGNVVEVKVKGKDGKEVTVKMRKSGDHWQIFEIPIDTATPQE